jgi:hypothetical protein
VHEPRLVGKSKAPDRELYLATIDDVRAWPVLLERPRHNFIVLTAIDATQLSDAELTTFAKKVLDQGCQWACTWGPDGGRVEIGFDLAQVDAEIAGTPYPDHVVTTSHEDESLDDALCFALFNAFPDVDAPSLLVIADPKWSSQIERRLSDSERLTADVLRDEEERSASGVKRKSALLPTLRRVRFRLGLSCRRSRRA